MQFSFSHHRLKINILWLPEQAHRFTGYLISDPGVLKEFLEINPNINNRLACLVREVMGLPYLKPVFVVFACLGVHIVEPVYANSSIAV